ncbi:hypothetical protein ACFWDQ_18355 [Streptomyces sp. NPDC060053]|uniref:hypothetical protein n=1 Tax=Streptomyces sp. NPDC060053 TaxID=3347047 RepID=UPI00369A0B06
MVIKPAWSTWQASQDWLLACTRNPSEVRRAWAAEELAHISTGEHWHVAEGPVLPSLGAMKHLGSRRLEPVLVDVAVGWSWPLLAAGLTDGLDDVPLPTLHPPGWQLASPPVQYSPGEHGWQERPESSGHLTDPTALASTCGLGGRLLVEALT